VSASAIKAKIKTVLRAVLAMGKSNFNYKLKITKIQI
jgi:hypothetical protein